MISIDNLALKAKTSEKCLKKLLKRLEYRFHRSMPEYMRFVHDQDGSLRSLAWELIRKYDKNAGGFIMFFESNVKFLIKTEYKKHRRFMTRGQEIIRQNIKLYKEPYYSPCDLIAEKESFYLACRDLDEQLTPLAQKIFRERLSPSKATIQISINDAFNKNGSDSPVRLRWKHISQSLSVPYIKLLNIVNKEIIPKAKEIFRKYGFCNPYEIRDKHMTDEQ
jgi:hypothetical protein